MLILASASPRRRELLTQAGFLFEVHPAHIPEEPYAGEEPAAYVTRLAREKAEAVFAEIKKAVVSGSSQGAHTAFLPASPLFPPSALKLWPKLLPSPSSH